MKIEIMLCFFFNYYEMKLGINSNRNYIRNINIGRLYINIIDLWMINGLLKKLKG